MLVAARRHPGPHPSGAWAQWHVEWSPGNPGPHTLLARATDETGATQPLRTPYNTMGYLFDGIVEHPVNVIR
jgi:hypothetical protein